MVEDESVLPRCCPRYYIKKRISIFEGKFYKTYGIKCIDRRKSLLKDIASVSSDKKAVEKIINLLNSNKISIYHFYDILEDTFY